MVKLISIAEAKANSRVDFCDDDALMDMLLEASSEAVLDYLKSQGYSSFYDGTALIADVPAKVRLATAHLTSIYYEYWSGDQEKNFADYGELPTPVVALLYRMRDPALC